MTALTDQNQMFRTRRRRARLHGLRNISGIAFAIMLVFALPASPCWSQGTNQNAIAAEIMRLGYFESDDQKKEILIKECRMTLRNFRDWQGQDNVFMAQSDLNIADIRFPRPNTEGRAFYWSPALTGDQVSTAMATLFAREGAKFAAETAIFTGSRINGAFDPSPRAGPNGVGDYVYQEYSHVRLVRDGFERPEDMARLLELLEQYQQDYCILIG